MHVLFEMAGMVEDAGADVHPDTPHTSVLRTPAAFRDIILDREIWKQTGEEQQLAILVRMGRLLSGNAHREFNETRMRSLRMCCGVVCSGCVVMCAVPCRVVLRCATGAGY